MDFDGKKFKTSPEENEEYTEDSDATGDCAEKTLRTSGLEKNIVEKIME